MYSDKLVIGLFSPDEFVSNITVIKRILTNEEIVDIIQLDNSSETVKKLEKHIGQYINNKTQITLDCEIKNKNCIFKTVDKAVKLIDHDYKEIYSRSWPLLNHFLALEYKFKNPNAEWNAEFSDPILINMSNQYRQSNKITDIKLIDKWNKEIKKLNQEFPLIEKNTSIFYIAEYLIFLFADKITFSNENQRELILERFPVDIKEFVMDKSETSLHPTLNSQFYHMENIDLDIDESYINIGYFGGGYYGKRHFEQLFYSFDSLNHKYKDKLKLYIFVEDTKLIKKLIKNLDSTSNIIIKKPMDYLKFLNATTYFDVLIVNDSITQSVFEKNPYIPSKVSDYLGSGSEIWAICEPGSILSSLDIKYKSNIYDYESSRDVLINILESNGYADEDYTVNNYFEDRLTSLNQIIDADYRKILRLTDEVNKLKKQNKKLKKEKDDLVNSNSWKFTKPLRSLKNIKK